MHGALVQYTGVELDSLFRLVADDVAANVIVLALAAEAVFHHYNDGADIINIARHNF
ncbi:MAG: hypothetical protein GY779_17395 [Gammaproteobacteria bacterium]|nr:hypothetical protein [Gammaproteobacteria bacterium]